MMAEKKKYLIIVSGPTASGKTAFAIQLAKHFNTAILSSDSRQFYREMSIGTAKPTSEEQNTVKHYFIGHLSIRDEYSVGAFERDTLELLTKLYLQNDVIILAGGSGLYIKALCEGLDEFPAVPPSLKDELNTWYENNGLKALQEAVAGADPEYYSSVDQQNPHRLLRALAVYRVSGKPYSSFRKQKASQRPFFPIYLWMDWPRNQLYQRINDRVDRMVEEGLVEEARQLYSLRHLTALQTVGYQELFDHFEGNTDLETSIDLIKRNSRRYAKRQLTWSRRDGFWKHFRQEEYDLALSYINHCIAAHWQIRTEVNGSLPPITKLILGNDEHFASLLLQTNKKIARLFEFQTSSEDSALSRYLLHEALLRAEGRPLSVELPAEIERLYQEVSPTT